MGFEYQIKFRRPPEDQLDGLLRTPSAFAGFDPTFGSYNYRDARSTGMPLAEARIESSGVYACVYGGNGWNVLRDLIALLLSEYNEISISKLGWE